MSPTPPTPVPTSTPTIANAQRISTDPFQGFGGQFATEVEPSVASDGANTLVAAFQQGRTLIAGGDAIGYATSLDGGVTWTSGTLPNLTRASGGGFGAASDAVVAYDAAHHVWLVASLPITNDTVPYATVSRSPDGIHWLAPVSLHSGDVSDDKEWIACDNNPTSPYRGRCYVAWDDGGNNGFIHTSYSTDGGATWSMPSSPADNATGIGTQILTAPNGSVTVVSDDFNEARVFAFSSRDGGTTWSASTPIAPIIDHFQAGNLRSGALVSAALDSAGIMYAIWQDCSFRASCTQDDLVLSTSTNGTQWSAPARIPIDPLSSPVDHFIPGLSIEPSTGGGAAVLALAYYSYAAAACSTQCALSADFIASRDGGATWGAPVALSLPMTDGSLAQTNQGRMVADYSTTTFVSQNPLSVFVFAQTPQGSVFNEATFATQPAAITTSSAIRRSSLGEHRVPHAHSDHGPRPHNNPPLPRN
jgi:hypothetical protein